MYNFYDQGLSYKKKQQRGNIKKASNNNFIKKFKKKNRNNSGEISLVLKENGYLDRREIKSLIAQLLKVLKNRSFASPKQKLRLNLLYFSTYTAKPTGVRMGKSKGSVQGWALKARPGTYILSLKTDSILTKPRAISLLKDASSKLSAKTIII